MKREIEDVIQQIKKQSLGKEMYLVAIDGRGGSGKSTVAEIIQKNVENVTIVHIDDFYLLSINRVLNAELPIDDNRLRMQLLEPLRQKKTAEYQQYDAAKDTMIASHTVFPKGIIIVEGWFSLYPTLLSYYDYKIWIEADKKTCLQRGLQREILEKQIDKEILLARWKNYQRLEDAYIDKYHPQKLADNMLYS